jgi:uncharacterized membrane protein SirB2
MRTAAVIGVNLRFNREKDQMAEYYADFKMLHIVAVVASGTLFLLRGIGVQLGAAFAMSAPVRYLSYTIDTVLLGAALALLWTLHEVLLGSTWIWVKIALLPVYIVLGSFALKRAKTKGARFVFFLAALAVFFWMYRIARAHDPLGGLLVWFGL